MNSTCGSNYRIIALGVAFCQLSFASLASSAPPSYQMTNLGALSGTGSTWGVDINDQNQITGYSTFISNLTGVHPFPWQNNVMFDLGVLHPQGSNPPDTDAKAVAINSAGEVAGSRYYQGSSTGGFVFQDTNANHASDPGELHVLASVPQEDYHFYYGINDAGQVVGSLESVAITHLRGFVATNSSLILIGTLPGDGESRPFSINNSGRVVGESNPSTSVGGRAMTWKDLNGNNSSDPGEMVEIPAPAGFINTVAIKINNTGMTVGNGMLNEHDRPFLWNDANHDGIPTASEVTDLSIPGYTYSFATDINDLGQIVGYAYNTGDNIQSFLWENGIWHNLNAVVPPAANSINWKALAINDNGWIVGGYNGASFVLIPTPEPSSLVLAALAIVIIVAGCMWRSRAKCVRPVA